VNSDFEASIWRRAGLWSLGGGLVAVFVAGLLRGAPGAVGAGVGALLAVLFFAVDLPIARRTRALDPTLTLGVVLLAYVLKLLLLTLFLAGFRGAQVWDGLSLAISAILITFVWIAAHIRSFVKKQWLAVEPAQINDSSDES
jgi:ATP synthase protein I